MRGSKVKKLREATKEPECKIDIRIQVFSDGNIHINAPENLKIFQEVLLQANRIMVEKYADQLPKVALPEKKIMLVH